MKKLLEIQMSVEKQNLEAFKKASKNMKVQMQYNLFKASKALIKNSLAGIIIKNRFLQTLDDLGSFSKDKIPLNTLKKMKKKNILASNLSADKIDMLDGAALKMKNPELHARHQREYMAWSKRKRDEVPQQLKSPRGQQQAAAANSKVAKISKALEAFVLKLNFNLRKLAFSMVDEKTKVDLFQPVPRRSRS